MIFHSLHEYVWALNINQDVPGKPCYFLLFIFQWFRCRIDWAKCPKDLFYILPTFSTIFQLLGYKWLRFHTSDTKQYYQGFCILSIPSLRTATLANWITSSPMGLTRKDISKVFLFKGNQIDICQCACWTNYASLVLTNPKSQLSIEWLMLCVFVWFLLVWRTFFVHVDCSKHEKRGNEMIRITRLNPMPLNAFINSLIFPNRRYLQVRFYTVRIEFSYKPLKWDKKGISLYLPHATSLKLSFRLSPQPDWLMEFSDAFIGPHYVNQSECQAKHGANSSGAPRG